MGRLPFLRITPHLLSVFIVAGLLASCAERPDLGDRTHDLPTNTPWPELLPLSGLNTSTIDGRQSDAQITAQVTSIAARANSLRNRARRLSNRDILTSAERQMLRGAIARH